MSLLALVLAMGSGPVRAEETRYSLADLESAARNKSWEEVLQHLGDVPETARDEHWRKLGESAAVSYLDSVSTGVDSFAGLGAAEDLIKRFSFLKKSRQVRRARDRIAMKGFEACFGLSNRGTGCLDRMTRFVSSEKEGAEIAFRAGKLASRAKPSAEAIPFFRHYLADSQDKAECSDEDVVKSVIFTLSLAPGSQYVAQAREIAMEECPERLKPFLKEALARKKRPGDYARNICSYLKKNADLDDKLRARCDKASRPEED